MSLVSSQTVKLGSVEPKAQYFRNKSTETSRFDLSTLKESFVRDSKNHVTMDFSLNVFELVEVNGYVQLKHKTTGKSYRVTLSAIRQVFTKLGYGKLLTEIVPEKFINYVVSNMDISQKSVEKTSLYTFIKYLPKTLLLELTNYLLATLPVAKEVFIFRFSLLDGIPYIKAVLDKKYSSFDNIEVINNILEIDNFKIEELNYDIDNFYMKLSVGTFNNEIKKVGEPVKYVITVSNSETGNSSLKMTSGILVLKCLNGMSTINESDSFKLVHNRKDNNVFKNSLVELVEKSSTSMNELLEKYEMAKSTKVDNATLLIKEISKENKLPEKVLNKLIETYNREYLKDKTHSLFHVVDSFTEVAHRNYTMLQQSRSQLEQIGVSLLYK